MVHFSSGVFVLKNQSPELLPLRARELSPAEESEVEAAVLVFCFRPSALTNLCKQGCPIPTPEAMMPLFTKAVAPHCPHQWGWWIDVWLWYLIKPTQLHSRGTDLLPHSSHSMHVAHKNSHWLCEKSHLAVEGSSLWSNCWKEKKRKERTTVLKSKRSNGGFQVSFVWKRNNKKKKRVCATTASYWVNYCPGVKSAAVISVTVAGYWPRTWSVFLFFFTTGDPNVRGESGATAWPSSHLHHVCRSCQLAEKGEPFNQLGLCNALKCLMPQSWCYIWAAST